jgi:hypothetical protein
VDDHSPSDPLPQSLAGLEVVLRPVAIKAASAARRGTSNPLPDVPLSPGGLRWCDTCSWQTRPFATPPVEAK